jgi:hypothetical protein
MQIFKGQFSMISRKLIVAIIVGAAGALSLTTDAHAGEGGAAGAAAFTVNASGQATGVAVSAAVGKLNAFAGAFNDYGQSVNSAFAYGSAGVITVTNIEPFVVSGITSATDTQLTVDQANNFNAQTTVNLGTTTGANLVVVQ